MASASDFLQEASLRAPAIEVVDVSSNRNSVDGMRDERRDDASVSGEDDDDDADLSLYEDALNGLLCDPESNEDRLVNTCTVEESHAFRKRLRLVGQDQFIVETIENETITAKKLCTAFGIRLPAFLEGEPDQAYYPLLGLGISRELSKRIKLPTYNTIDDAVALLVNSKNIIVLTGAGISTSLGIPDFRSKHTGLYSRLEHLGLSDPQEVFDIHLFREDPSIFYSVAKDILPSTNDFSPTHAFIKLLQDKHKLLTNFTQNIDNLEHHAGILPEKLIQCHGSFATATCVECKYKVAGQEIYKDLKAGHVARCDRCIRMLRQANSTGIKRKRSMASFGAGKKKRAEYEDSTDDEEYDIAVAGVMKPDITFFGEALPEAFHDRLIHHDRDKVDLVLVIGTSLKVAPVSEVSGILPPEIPQMYISREPCQHVDFDIDMFGDCDTIVTELCRRAGWDLRHKMIKSNDINVKQQDGYNSRFTFHIQEA